MSARIRLATGKDGEGIRGLHLRAFPEDESELVAELATSLLNDRSQPETIALVAETGDGVIGHIAFSPAAADALPNWVAYILAPLGVDPDHRRAGIGADLIARGLEWLSERDVDAVFVYGDPDYYGRFGFEVETAGNFLPPYQLTYPVGWQVMELHRGRPVDEPVRLSCVASLRDPALW